MLENASASVRSGDIFSAFIYLFTDSNSIVGYIQGINGIMQLVAAVPAGFLADHYRRDIVLRGAAMIGLTAGLTMATGLFFEGPVWVFVLAMALMGTYKGFNNPAIESIFADSVQTGKSMLYTYKHVATSLSSAFGPIISIIMFLSLGNKWEVLDCRLVLLVGLTFFLLPLTVMCCFNDDHSLGDTSEAVTVVQRSEQEPLKGSASEADLPGRRSSCSSAFLIPALITMSDLIGSLASGMTVKFFGLFFMQKCGLSPVAVSILAAVSPMFVAFGAFGAQAASKRCGRVPVTLVTRAADIGMMVAMAFLPTEGGVLTGLLLAIHLLRRCAANCTRPLMRSILMQHVPKRHRGKVNALDSIRTFSWSGSSAAGGVLIERFGFQNTFLITSCIKTASFIPLLGLLFLLREHTSAGRGQKEAVAVAESDDDALQAPLLHADEQEANARAQV